MTSPTFVTVAIDEQSIDVTVPPSPSIEVTPSEPLASVAVHSAAIDVTVAAPPAVDVSTVSQPFTVITVEGPPGRPGPAGQGTQIIGEVPIGLVNGSNTIFETANPYQPGSTVLYRNGLRQILGAHYTESAPSTITIDDAPLPDDEIIFDYLLQ